MPFYQINVDQKTVNLLFIHIPKTGGTAIEHYLPSIGFKAFFDPSSYMPVRNCLSIPPAHFDYELCDRLFRLERFYNFAIVREPVDKMVSEYKWAKTKSLLADRIKNFSFSDFVDFALEEYSRDQDFMAGHLKPQYRFVGPKTSRVFKYEDGLNSILKRVLDDVGLAFSGEIAIPRINKSEEIKVSLGENELKLIQKHYSDDYETFGYAPRLA